MPEESYKSFVYDSLQDFNIQYIESSVLIHFRPAKDWQGKGYGFDWMRECDYKGVSPNNALGDKKKYVDTIVKHYRPRRDESDDLNPTKSMIGGKPYFLENNGNAYKGTFIPDPDSFYNLEKMYNYHQIPTKKLKIRKHYDVGFEAYYCPWLSIYPGKTATISIIAELITNEIPDSYELKYNETLFDINFQKQEDLKGLKKGEKKGIADAITIKCLEEFNKDQIISIYSLKGTKKKLAGKLYVWSNESTKRKIAKIVSVLVKTKSFESLIGGDKNIIDSTKDSNAEFLRQGLIELNEQNEHIEIDLSSNTEFQRLYNQPEGIIAYYYTIPIQTYNEEKSRWEITYEQAPEGYRRLSDYLNYQLQDIAGNKYDDHLKIFYLDARGGGLSLKSSTERVLSENLGQSDGNSVILIYGNVEAETITHEILHAFNLAHSFSNREYQKTNKHTYEYKTTDNIMDYSHHAMPVIPMNCLWKWQWELANGSIKTDGTIKTITFQVPEN